MRASPTSRRQRGERGSTTLEVAILAPILLLVVFTIVQVALWCFASSLALGAAQEGVAAARAESGNAMAGRVHALDFIGRTGQHSLIGPHVHVRATEAEVEVKVTGRAPSVVPGVQGLPVQQSARGPVERFTRP